jgi:hypothetical protein
MSLQATAGIVLRRVHEHLLPNIFQFIIILPFEDKWHSVVKLPHCVNVIRLDSQSTIFQVERLKRKGRVGDKDGKEKLQEERGERKGR